MCGSVRECADMCGYMWIDTVVYADRYRSECENRQVNDKKTVFVCKAGKLANEETLLLIFMAQFPAFALKQLSQLLTTACIHIFTTQFEALTDLWS